MDVETTSTLQRFLKYPFETIDSLCLDFHGFQLNILRNDEKLRKALLNIFLIPPLIAWVLLGPDSTADQVAWALLEIRTLDLNRILQTYNSYYGLGTHWSAAVIYSAMFIGLSKHLAEKLDIRNSLNLALTCGFVGLSIACFEFYWMGSYYYFQNQTWILAPVMPQLRIILQNVLFMSPGLLVLLGLNYREYSLNLEAKTILLFAASTGLLLFWWFYPFPTQQLTVPLLNGEVWKSSPNFPQTMYTIDLNPSDTVAVGEMFHIQDEAVHLVNNLCKILLTMSFYNLFKIQRRRDSNG